MKARILLAATAFFISGCNATTDIVPVPTPTTALELTVQFAGNCGIVPVGGHCDSSPSPSQVPLTIKRLPAQEVVSLVTPDANGFFYQALNSGKYLIELKERNPNLQAIPLEVNLINGETKRITFTISALRP